MVMRKYLIQSQTSLDKILTVLSLKFEARGGRIEPRSISHSGHAVHLVIARLGGRGAVERVIAPSIAAI